MELNPDELAELYNNRFEGRTEKRDALWSVLCKHFFQRWIPEDSTVLDLAAGECEFSNNITAKRRIALDLSSALPNWAGPGVETVVGQCDDLTQFKPGSIDRVFVSNFFEHISRELILDTLRAVHRVLPADGKLLILQPNIRYVRRDYWMFFDHITPIDDRALVEALVQTGYTVEKCISRFVPYTTKGRLPSPPWVVRLYLKIPLAWRIFGGQAFIVARPNTAG